MSDKSQDFGYSWINSSRSSSPSISFKENCSDCNKNKTLELILGKLELQNSLIKQHFSVSNKDLQKEKNLEELKNKIMQEKILALTEKVNDQQIMLQQMQLKFNDDKTEKDNEIHQPIKKPYVPPSIRNKQDQYIRELELENKKLETKVKELEDDTEKMEEKINTLEQNSTEHVALMNKNTQLKNQIEEITESFEILIDSFEIFKEEFTKNFKKLDNQLFIARDCINDDQGENQFEVDYTQQYRYNDNSDYSISNYHPPSEYIKIKFVDQNDFEVPFRVQYGTNMGKLKKAYAEHNGVSVNTYRFLFNGIRVTDDDTPNILRMKEGDSLKAIL